MTYAKTIKQFPSLRNFEIVVYIPNKELLKFHIIQLWECKPNLKTDKFTFEKFKFTYHFDDEDWKDIINLILKVDKDQIEINNGIYIHNIKQYFDQHNIIDWEDLEVGVINNSKHYLTVTYD